MQTVETVVGPVVVEDFETVVSVNRVLFEHEGEFSAVERLTRLSGADRPEDIGRHGPVTASTVDGDVAPELRRIQAVFGRDALIVSRLVADAYPQLRRATVEYFAAAQGVDAAHAPDPDEYLARVEGKGKIPHELRDPASDQFAAELTEERGWRWPYFGSDDATALYVREALAAMDHDPRFAHHRVTQRDGEERTIAETVRRAAQWIFDQLGDHGLFWSTPQSHGALPLWKDSGPVVPYFTANGDIAHTSVASIELQTLSHDALRLVADSPHLDGTDPWAAEAKKLRETVLEHFWVRDDAGAFFAAAVDRTDDGALRALDARTSNMGHVIASTLLDGDDAADYRTATAAALVHPELLSAWGVRTLAKSNPHYRAGSYHAGSVWPWENWLFSRALLDHGFEREGNDIGERTKAVFARTHRFPEFVWGDDSKEPVIGDVSVVVKATINGIEQTYESLPVPQPFQAWSVAAAVCMGI